MLIHYIEPIGSDLHVPRTRSVLESFAPPGVDVEVRHLTLPPELAGPMLPPRPLYLSELQRAVFEAEAEGADAAIIGCCSDPGLQDAQRSAGIPVVGPLQAAAAVAASRGKTLGILFPDEHDWRTTENWTRRNLRMYGMNEVVTVIDFVPMHVEGEESLVEDASATAEEVERRFRRQITGPGVEKANELLARSSVDALMFGCTIWGGMVREVADHIDALCLDPVATAFHVAVAQASVTASTAARQPG